MKVHNEHVKQVDLDLINRGMPEDGWHAMLRTVAAMLPTSATAEIISESTTESALYFSAFMMPSDAYSLHHNLASLRDVIASAPKGDIIELDVSIESTDRDYITVYRG